MGHRMRFAWRLYVAAVVACGCSAPTSEGVVSTAGEAIVYGNDDRVQTELSGMPGALPLGRSSAALIPLYRLDLSDSEHIRILSPNLAEAWGVCADEAFASESTAADCSGTLIAPELLLTAGHCVSANATSDTRVVFGYVMRDGAPAPITAGDVYLVDEVVVRQMQSNVDFAVLRLDRPVEGREPAPIRIGDAPLIDAAELFVIGHPSGLPQKFAAGAQVDDPRASSLDYFTANLDVFPSSSGGGVFDANAGELVGLVARGPAATYLDSAGEGCKRALVVADDFRDQIEATYVQRALDDLCQVHPVSKLCSCGNGICDLDQRETTGSCPVDCGTACGDEVCNGTESAAICYQDCGSCGNGVCEPDEVARQSCCEDCGCPGGYACRTDTTNSCLPKLGNVNADATLDVADVQLVSWVAGGRAARPLDWRLADVDCNGTVTEDDAVYLAEFVSGKRAVLPCESITSLALGTRHSCALIDGTVSCWGDNTEGQLGTSNRPEGASAANSVAVGLRRRVTRIAAGSEHTCALDIDGKVRCWGSNGFAQLGRGRSNATAFPAVELASAAVEIAAGANFSCAVLAGGTVQCWGDNQSGQLGAGPRPVNQLGIAPPVELPDGAEQIALGASHVCAKTASGSVYCWGANHFGQLGLGHTRAIGDDELPTASSPVQLGAPALEINAFWMQSCARLQGGVWRCWGENTFGQLGYPASMPIGDDESPIAVAPVPLPTDVRSLVLGQTRTCSLSTTGSVRCWGLDLNGQLGYGTSSGSPPSPPPLPGLPATSVAPAAASTTPSALPPLDLSSPASALFGGGQFSCALLRSGSLTCWGANQSGQLGYAHRTSVGDDETPAQAGAVPVTREPELGWTPINSRKLEVWRNDAYTPTHHGAVGFLVYEREQDQVKDFRLYYSISGTERPSVPIEIAAEFTPRSQARVLKEKARDIWTLELSFGRAARSSAWFPAESFGAEWVWLGYSDSGAWHSGNDYSASDHWFPYAWHPTVRVQVVGPDNSVWYGWTRPADPS